MSWVIYMGHTSSKIVVKLHFFDVILFLLNGRLGMSEFGNDYFEENGQAEDRIALKFYAKVFSKTFPNSGSKKPVILEYGSGVGHLVKRLAADFNCYAQDISEYALSQVKINAPKVRVIKKTAVLKKESLDGIISLHVLEHIKKPLDTLKEFNRLLKEDGNLFVVVPNPEGLGHKLKKKDWFAFTDKTHVSLLKKKEWEDLFNKAGFKIFWVRGDGLWDVPYIKGIPLSIQKLIFFPPAFLQILFGKVFLPVVLGECLVIMAKKVN